MDEDDIVEAAGKGMAAILLANNVLGALILSGTLTYEQARQLVDTAREGAAKLPNRDMAIMAVAALNGLETSWKRVAPKSKT